MRNAGVLFHCEGRGSRGVCGLSVWVRSTIFRWPAFNSLMSSSKTVDILALPKKQMAIGSWQLAKSKAKANPKPTTETRHGGLAARRHGETELELPKLLPLSGTKIAVIEEQSVIPQWLIASLQTLHVLLKL